MASEDQPGANAADSGRCPICRAPTARDYRPFCSGRCRDVDLLRWLRGAYAIPGGQADADEDGEDASVKHASYLRDDEDEEAAE